MANYLAAVKLKRNGQTMTVTYSTVMESTAHAVQRMMELSKVTSLDDFEDYEVFKMLNDKDMQPVAASHDRKPPVATPVPALTLVPLTPDPVPFEEAAYNPYTREVA